MSRFRPERWTTVLALGTLAWLTASPSAAQTGSLAPDREQLVELARLADAGDLVPAIDSTFSLERAGEAFDRVAAHGKRGKVVLDVAG